MKKKKSPIKKINAKGFAKDLDKLRKETIASLSIDDFKHLKKMQLWGKISTILGFGTAWIFPNPISAFLISQGISARWLLMHHIGHGGYDTIQGVPKRYTSKGFAVGKRRFIDWFDWMPTDGWKKEHNILHHYNVGEEKDPDCPERHSPYSYGPSKHPNFIRYALAILYGMTWKFMYYVPNTFNTIHPLPKGILTKFNIFNKNVRKMWVTCYLPYILFYFVAIPLLFLPLGSTASLFVLINVLLAEFIANLHAFIVIVPNHTGHDLFRFTKPAKNRDEFFVRQVVGSVNYNCGKDSIDFLQFWLNYQIEHHIFPDLPLATYQRIQPKVKELCKKHNIPYIQESVWIRFKKMLDITIAKTKITTIKNISNV